MLQGQPRRGPALILGSGPGAKCPAFARIRPRGSGGWCTEPPDGSSAGHRLVHPHERGVVDMRSVPTKAAFAAALLLTLGTTAVGLARVHTTTRVSFSIATKLTDGKPAHFTYS